MDIDLTLKALHVAAALTFAGGLLADSLIIAACSVVPENRKLPDVPAALEVMRRWDRRITTPAMLIVWSAGITMAIRGSWFASPWLMIKLVIVLLLSVLHGALSGLLLRLGRDPVQRVPPTMLYAAPAVVVGVSLISILVVAKPF
jgi:protoporphyrinogen IX oxidase